MRQSEELLEALITAICEPCSERDEHLFREALHSLTRLARMEERALLQVDDDENEPPRWLH